MTRNRSVPEASVIPVLGYENVREAIDWLGRAFGLRLRLRIGEHRAQLTFGNGAVIVTAGRAAAASVVHVRVPDADAHYARAVAAGARVLELPADYPYGERQYTAEDPGGHRWTFSESIADIDPAAWGATDVDLD